jgi:hypothetical protein
MTLGLNSLGCQRPASIDRFVLIDGKGKCKFNFSQETKETVITETN